MPDTLTSGLTVADLAKRLRVSQDKIRAWITRGELVAVNTAAALCGRPRWVIAPEALAEFERRRAGAPTPKTPRRRKRTNDVDYYP
jgi:excisionase family DNA binding protein